MTCEYCNDTGMVGGVMPWKNGTAHANPCPDCTSSPALKFKPGVTPWTGCIMPVPDVNKDTPGFSTYAEPDLPGERVIVVIAPDFRIWCWGEFGRYAVSQLLIDELTVLASQAMFDAPLDEYQCGVAIEGIMSGGDLMIYMLVPLIALLDGEDTQQMGLRRMDLERAVAAVGEALAYKVVPRVMVHASPKVKPANLDAACDALETNRIMVKQTLGYWGVTPCWSRYEREEDF